MKKIKDIALFLLMWVLFLILFLTAWASAAQYFTALQIHVPTYFYTCLSLSFILTYILSWVD